MNIQENINRIKEIMDLNESKETYNILEYIDIPISKNGDTKNNDKPSYNTKEKFNTVVDIYGGDFLQIKELIQNALPNQNLKYLGAGAMGLSFVPYGSLNFPKNFKENNFIGTLPAENANIVLKVTTNLGEVNKITDVIRAKHKMPGIVNYYFIKGIDLPSEKQYSTTYGPPDARIKGIDNRNRIDNIIKQKVDQWGRMANPNLNDAQIEKKLQKIYKSFIKDKINTKRELKTEKIYIICMDKVELPNGKEKDYINVSFEYYYDANKQKSNKGSKPINILKSIYLKEHTMRRWYDEKMKEDDFIKEINHIPSFEIFVATTKKLFDALEIIYSGSKKPGELDLHSGNIGISGDKFLFFDMFA